MNRAVKILKYIVVVLAVLAVVLAISLVLYPLLAPSAYWLYLLLMLALGWCVGSYLLPPLTRWAARR